MFELLLQLKQAKLDKNRNLIYKLKKLITTYI